MVDNVNIAVIANVITSAREDVLAAQEQREVCSQVKHEMLLNIANAM